MSRLCYERNRSRRYTHNCPAGIRMSRERLATTLEVREHAIEQWQIHLPLLLRRDVQRKVILLFTEGSECPALYPVRDIGHDVSRLDTVNENAVGFGRPAGIGGGFLTCRAQREVDGHGFVDLAEGIIRRDGARSVGVDIWREEADDIGAIAALWTLVCRVRLGLPAVRDGYLEVEALVCIDRPAIGGSRLYGRMRRHCRGRCGLLRLPASRYARTASR